MKQIGVKASRRRPKNPDTMRGGEKLQHCIRRRRRSQVKMKSCPRNHLYLRPRPTGGVLRLCGNRKDSGQIALNVDLDLAWKRIRFTPVKPPEIVG